MQCDSNQIKWDILNTWTLENKTISWVLGCFFPLSDIGIVFFNNCAVLRPWFLFFKHYIHIDKFCVIFEFFFLELNCNKINNSSWQTSLMQLLNWLSNYTTLIPVLPHMNYEFLEYLMCWYRHQLNCLIMKFSLNQIPFFKIECITDLNIYITISLLQQKKNKRNASQKLAYC